MRKPQKEIQLTSYNELLGIDDSVNPGTDRIGDSYIRPASV